MLVFDDLHSADDSLLDFVDHLVDWASGVPILVLATARPELLERRSDWGGGKPNASTLTIAPLSDEETHRLLGALLEQPLLTAERQSDLLARAGRQSPLRRAIRADALRVRLRPTRCRSRKPCKGSSRPASISSRARTSACSRTRPWSARCSGAEPPRRSTGTIPPRSTSSCTRSGGNSSCSGPRPLRLQTRREYSFRHLLVRDVAYGQIPRAARAAKHRAAAAWIEGLPRAGRLRGDACAPLWGGARARPRDRRRDRGARGTDARGSPRRRRSRVCARVASRPPVSTIAAPWSSGRPRAPTGPGSWSVTAAEASSRSMRPSSWFEPGTPSWSPATPRTPPKPSCTCSGTRGTRGAERRSRARYERLLELADQLEPSHTKAYLLASLAIQLMLTTQLDRALETATRSLQIAERLGFDDIRAHALNTIGMCRAARGDRAGLDQLEQSLALSVEQRTRRTSSAATRILARSASTTATSKAWMTSTPTPWPPRNGSAMTSTCVGLQLSELRSIF